MLVIPSKLQILITQMEVQYNQTISKDKTVTFLPKLIAIIINNLQL